MPRERFIKTASTFNDFPGQCVQGSKTAETVRGGETTEQRPRKPAHSASTSLVLGVMRDLTPLDMFFVKIVRMWQRLSGLHAIRTHAYGRLTGQNQQEEDETSCSTRDCQRVVGIKWYGDKTVRRENCDKAENRESHQLAPLCRHRIGTWWPTGLHRTHAVACRYAGLKNPCSSLFVRGSRKPETRDSQGGIPDKLTSIDSLCHVAVSRKRPVMAGC